MAEDKKTAPRPNTNATKKVPPKGGRKGGTIFPRVPLKQALDYAKKLVSKTAVAPQPEATILAGVFNNGGPEGRIRLSALKQFGLLEGKASGYKATELARSIDAAVDDVEKRPLLEQALLASKVYRELFNTYQGDQASKAKIRSRAQQLDVHPDVSEKCADLFIASALAAGVGTGEGDGIRLKGAINVPQAETAAGDNLPEQVEAPQSEEEVADPIAGSTRRERPPGAAHSQADSDSDVAGVAAPRPRTAADVTLNLTVDSSLDGDKLEKQLALLRRYGLI